LLSIDGSEKFVRVQNEMICRCLKNAGVTGKGLPREAPTGAVSSGFQDDFQVIIRRREMANYSSQLTQ